MKTRVILLFALLLCMGTNTSFAQISTGEPSAKVIRTGNRAQAGDFGLYLGATSNMFKGIFDSNVKLSALPLINLKYMTTDNLEVRLGIELFGESEKLKGDIADDGTSIKNKFSRTEAMLYPGFAYHFSKNNILDVYAGVELPLGWNSNRNIYEYDGDKTSVTKNSFTIGLGAFIGLQAYIANLPLAVGIEYGLSSRFDTGLKYKYESDDQTYYTPDLESFKHLDVDDQYYDKLKAKKGALGSQFRVTLTYYFK